MTNEQSNAFPGSDAPAGSIIPPTAAAFENATYITAGPNIEHIVNALIDDRDEYEDLRGVVVAVVWSRNQTRKMAGEPLLSWPALVGNLETHFAKEVEANLPELAIVLSYKAADAMRSEGQYLHPQILERHLARALLMVEVSEGGIIKTRAATVQTFPELVGHYGAHAEGEVALRAQLELFEGDEAGRQQRAGRRPKQEAAVHTTSTDGDNAPAGEA